MKLISSLWLQSIFLFFIVDNFAIAGDDYICTIERLSLAQGDSGKVYENYSNIYIGKKFTIERYTGLMAGTLKNSYITKPQVIDYGSSENSYKVVTTMKLNEGLGSGSNINALTVNEYEEDSKKSFVYLMNDWVYFGHCVHF
jgi:predicted small secreted protein